MNILKKIKTWHEGHQWRLQTEYNMTDYEMTWVHKGIGVLIGIALCLVF